jgi:SAM-dependent methyltransferase
MGAALDAGLVTRGTRVLDAGCGAGLAMLLGRLRGAMVTGIDASPALVEIACERLPGADLRVGDLEALPFDDAVFDAVLAVNSIFYATDMTSAMRELVRVTARGGRVVVTSWGPADRNEFLADALPRVRPFLPPPAPGSRGGPGPLGLPGALRALLEEAGLHVVDEGETACPFVFPDADASWRANASAGPNQLAVAYSGEAAVREAFLEADRSHTRRDGTVRYENTFLWAAGTRG